MKNIFKYVIIIIVLIIVSFIVMSFYNDDSKMDIAENLINKIITSSFTEEEKELLGVQEFYNTLYLFDCYYIPIDYCELISVSESSLNQFGSDTPTSEDGIDSESLIYSELKLKFIDNFEKSGYTNKVKYKYYNDVLYIHLNSFEIEDGAYQIKIDDYIFSIPFASVPMTFQNYVEDILNNRNVFEITDVVVQDKSILYTFSDRINGYDIIVRFDKDFFNYADDIKISLPFKIKTNNLGVCKIFEN